MNNNDICGFLTLFGHKFTFDLKDYTLHLLLTSDTADKEWSKEIIEHFSKPQWIYGETKYYFHCYAPYFPGENEIRFSVDYYAIWFSNNSFDDFGNTIVDGFSFSEDYLETFFDQNEICRQSSFDKENGFVNSIKLPQKECIISETINVSLGYFWKKTGFSTPLKISNLKPRFVLTRQKTSINELMEIFNNTMNALAFLFKERAIHTSQINIFNCSDNNLNFFGVIFFPEDNSSETTNRLKSSPLLFPFFKDFYTLFEDRWLSPIHLPIVSILDISSLVLMCSWFEKKYKYFVKKKKKNKEYYLKPDKNGCNLYRHSSEKNKKDDRVSLNEQLNLFMKNNTIIQEIANDFLFRFGGFFEYKSFVDKFAKRISDNRNAIIHNKDEIVHEKFFFHDIMFMEIINCYLIFKYKCNCTDTQIQEVIRKYFHFDISAE